MADGLPPRPPADTNGPGVPEDDGAPAPPALTEVRVKGPSAKGLNKPAILIAAGGGLAVVLIAATTTMSPDPSKRPTETKPLMSAPARPELAQGAVRNLPATYEQVAVQQASLSPAQAPLLGPSLPGDIAAFAPHDPVSRPDNYDDWSSAPSYSQQDQPDPAAIEAAQAERSQIFFSLRQEPAKASGNAPPAVAQPRDPLTTRVQPPSPAPGVDGIERTLFPGTVISASLVTEISSESPGPVIAQITQTIYDSTTGRTALIPQGARLIGDYKSSTRYGQSRIAILWSRIIMPNGDEIALDELALDPAGTGGVSGKVDNHWLDVFGAAALGTLINIGVAAAEEPQLTYGGIGVITRDPVDRAVSDGVQRTANIVTNRVVDRSLAIPPTINVVAGKRLVVVVTRRVSLP